MKNQVIFTIIALAIINLGILGIVVYQVKGLTVPTPDERLAKVNPVLTITMKDKTFNATVADTEDKRVRGLSGQDDLLPTDVMLFVFPKSDFWGIWMKDMNFPIDIVWLDANRSVVSMQEDARPESFPFVFEPRVPAKYVVEAKSGFIRSLDLREGDIMDLRYQ